MSLAAITARPRALLVKRSEAWTCDVGIRGRKDATSPLTARCNGALCADARAASEQETH